MIKYAARVASFLSSQMSRACLVLFIVGGGLVVSGHPVHAETLYFSPSSGSYAVGATFTVNALVSSPYQASNGYSGSITYPTDKLDLVSVGKGGSIISFWTSEPGFSNGTASFEGVAFNPGYTGPGGKLISLTFKAKSAGAAIVRFTSGSILANDGQGTNILKGLGVATYTITSGTTPPPVTPPPTPKEVVGTPSAPVISSPTHPDPTKWYAESTATFKWGLQNGVDGVAIIADQIATTNPGTHSQGLFSSHTYDNVKDGVWYFHARVQNKNGWSAVSNFKFQIDTQKPDSFTIRPVASTDPSQTTQAFIFEASDSGSSIDHYEVQIDSGVAVNWVDDGSHTYHVPSVGPGAHTLNAKAVDKAGNFLTATAEFSAQALVPPRITDSPKTAYSGDGLIVKGITYPLSQVTVWIQKDSDRPYSQQVKSDEQGRFTFVADEKLQNGEYQVWATVTDPRGNISDPSEKVSVSVKPPPFDVWGWIISIISSIGLAVVVIWLLILIILLILWRYYVLTKRLTKDIHGAQKALHEAFDLLKDDMQDQVMLLEKTKTKRELTLEEGKILKKLKRDLKVAEECIRKKIEHIEKLK